MSDMSLKEAIGEASKEEAMEDLQRQVAGFQVSREQEKKRTDDVKAQLEAQKEAMRQEFEAELARLSKENEKLEDDIDSKQRYIYQLEAQVESARKETAKEAARARDAGQQFIGAQKVVSSIIE